MQHDLFLWKIDVKMHFFEIFGAPVLFSSISSAFLLPSLPTKVVYPLTKICTKYGKHRKTTPNYLCDFSTVWAVFGSTENFCNLAKVLYF